MRNPTNHRNEPVCPICARTFKPGDPVMLLRADDYMIHMTCADEADARDDAHGTPLDRPGP